ncbi:MAG: hypothetical protein EBU51_08935 [Synechococcaceae bacterium WB6_3A_227]|nr:hypothetical protein [Synechococcaceae bacterium WB6_3A_227]
MAAVASKCEYGYPLLALNELHYRHFSQTTKDYLHFCYTFLIHPVLADGRKIETINLESLKKNWVDEINNTEYMQQLPGSFSQKNIPSPNCDRHGCYNNGSNKSSW